MRAQVFQHVPFEGPGHFAPSLRRAGFQLAVTECFAAPRLPDPESVDFLLLMGGPMSVNDEDLLPWLKDEKEFIRRFSKTGKPMLGVCLGAQLIASALGARVHPNPAKEIGWFPVTAAGEPAGGLRLAPSISPAAAPANTRPSNSAAQPSASSSISKPPPNPPRP